jgi:hypothetical protein
VQEVLHADWQEAWHSPHPVSLPFLMVDLTIVFYMFHHEPPIKPFNLEHYSIWNRRCKYTVSFGKKAKEAVKRRFQENTAKKKPRPAENNCF